MNKRLYQLLLIVSASLGTFTLCAASATLYAQHVAVGHHSAHFEVNSWGLSTFHWNDEYAQTPVADPVNDSLTPPSLTTKTNKK